MRSDNSSQTISIDHCEKADTTEEDETIAFDRLIRLVEEDGLIRLGLRLMERVAQEEGRALWH